MKSPFNLVNCFIVCIMVFVLFSCNPVSMTIEETEDGVWIGENEQPVLFYQSKTKSLDGQYARANYVHPLFDLNGNIITEDFPEDHYHHRGIFWTWHQVWIDSQRIGDAWLCEDFIWDVRQIETKVTDYAEIKATVDWKSPTWKNGSVAFATENVLIKAYPKKGDYRTVDFEISISSLVDCLYIGGSEDVKGYGGFSTRVKLPDDLQFFSEGKSVEPQTTAVKAGSWMNMNGTFHDRAKSGFVIIQHPDNPDFIQPWILRSKRSMQNPVYPGREPVLLEKDNPLRLNYRVVMYNGEVENFNFSDVSY